MSDELIGNIGVGLFAVLMVAAFAFLLAIVLSYMVPDATFFIFVGCTVLPVLTFALIMSAPYEPLGSAVNYHAVSTTQAPTTPKLPASTFYPNDGPPDDLSDLVDNWLPVRIVMMVIVCLGIIIGLVYVVVLALTAPPYVAPQVQCLRRQLEQLHPTWYR